MSYNIKQITNYDLEDTPIEYIQGIPYKKAISDVKIIKLGYCCEPKDIYNPIYIETNTVYKPVKIGKTGMYEFQPEQWIDNEKERTTNAVVTGVKVPATATFTLDYVV